MRSSRDAGNRLRSYSSLLRALPIGPVLSSPLLLAQGFRTWRDMVPRSWWRRRPFLPVPDAAWMAFRLETGFGSAGDHPQPDDVLEVLRWSAEFRHTLRSRHQAAR